MSDVPSVCQTCGQALSREGPESFLCPAGHRLTMKTLAGNLTASGSISTKTDLLEDAVAELQRGSRRRRKVFPAVATVAAAGDLAAAAVAGNWLEAIGPAGLLFDIAGAGLLTIGLVLTPRQVQEMGTSRYNGNPFPRAYWDAARLDAYAALVLLGIGFALQAISSGLGGATR
jgi:hypothetical protein